MTREPISEQAERLFEAALLQPEDRQDAFVRESAGDDSALEREVQSLLVAARQADRYFDELSDRLGIQSIVDGSWELPLATSIGSYELIRLIGRGGMGAVYLAERADEQYQKQVAIKILPVGFGDDKARVRFLAERQILARLVHPNIARLLDGGIAEHGAPYFVMDYVDGEPMDKYANRHRLTVHDRLKLFDAVADAVAYAHQNLVIHRDIKPDNVLVDTDGNVRLVDFGIAGFVDDRDDAVIRQAPADGNPVTINYASPETIRGEAPTTATDVYSLGALLYVLLAGRYPHAVDRRASVEGSDPELLGSLWMKEPRPASLFDASDAAQRIAHDRSTTINELARYLRGDLDAILAKALHGNAQHRYRSVEQLQADLARFRSAEPVSARQATVFYRASRFFRRHTWQAAAAAVASAGLIAVVVLSGRYALDMQEQAQLVAEERDVAEGVRRFWLDTFRLSEQSGSDAGAVSAKALLEQSVTRVKQDYRDRPAMQATILSTLGDAFAGQSLYQRAIDQHEEALAIRRGLPGPQSPLVADNLTAIARAKTSLGQLEGAALAVDQALVIRQHFNDEVGIAELLVIRGRLMLHDRKPADAQRLFEESLVLRRRLLGENHVDTARTLSNLGAALYMQGDLDASEHAQRQAVAIHRRLNSDADLMAQPLINLAMVQLRLKKFDEANGHFTEAAAGTATEVPGQDVRRAFALNGLALTDRELGKNSEAVQHAREAWQIASQFIEPSPRLARFGQNYGRALLTTEEFGEAERIIREAIGMLESDYPEHTTLPSLYVDLGRIYLAQSQLQHAEPLLNENYRKLVDTVGENHVNTAIARAALEDLRERSAK